MHKNKILLIALLLYGTTLSAQISFFIKPRVMMKTTRSFYITEGFLNNDNAMNFATNNYYNFVNHGHHFSNSKINWGISAGVKFDNKNSLELVFSADASSVKRSFVYYNKYSELNAVYSNTFLWGRDFARLNIEYNRTFLNKPRYKLRSIVGAGVFLLQIRTESFPTGLENQFFSANVEQKNINANSFAPIFQFGFGIDFKTKRNVPIFSLDIFATLNFTTHVQVVRYEVSLIDKIDGNPHRFTHTLVSRGSGINFQLSRPIQFYPWRPNKKEVL